jgi:hypothetical protein
VQATLSYSSGDTGGEAKTSMVIPEMPGHTHDMCFPTQDFTVGGQHALIPNAGGPWPAGASAKFTSSCTGACGPGVYCPTGMPVGGAGTTLKPGDAQENRPPYIAVLICKKD